MMNNLSYLMEQHELLKSKDGKVSGNRTPFKIVGSSTHQYRFNPCASLLQVEQFEQKHNIRFPEAYKTFLTQIGNGGSGPGYGLLPLQQWDAELEVKKEPEFLSRPFSHTSSWNLIQKFNFKDPAAEDAFAQWEEKYFSNTHVNGSIRLAHFGTGTYHILVVSGPEKGNIWVDDRANENGIHPVGTKEKERIGFLDWYQSWLTESLAQF